MESSLMPEQEESAEVKKAKQIFQCHLSIINPKSENRTQEDYQKATEATYFTLDELINSDTWFTTLEASKKFTAFYMKVQEEATWMFVNLYGTREKTHL